MKEEKLQLILKDMQGITYPEWKKLSHVIDCYFSSEASAREKEIKMESPEVIMNSYKRLF